MNRKLIQIILISLLAFMLAGCEGMDVVHQTQPADTTPKATVSPTEDPTEETPPVTEDPTEETVPVTGDPTEETSPVTEDPTEETAPVTETPTQQTAPVTETPTQQTAPPTETPAQTVPPTAAPTQTAAPTPTVPPPAKPTQTVPPTQKPTAAPTAKPTATVKPTAAPTAKPTPTAAPTVTPTQKPSGGTSYTASYPSAPGTAVEMNDSAVIDYSNAKDGYVMIKWTGEAVKVAVQVTGPKNSEKYTYYLRTDGSYDVIPLSDGNGTYKFLVCKNVSGTTYAQALAASISVKLSSSLAPFLRPNQYVNYTASSQAVKQAKELVKNAENNLGKVQAVYNWVVTNLSYDYDKAKTVQSGYLPDVDKVMKNKKGICFDYAALMSAMLRSQGVPVKLVVGYTSTGEYHAWINVWSNEAGWMDSVIYFDGKTWKLMDPTFASTGKQSQSIMEYIGNTANYKERFAY